MQGDFRPGPSRRTPPLALSFPGEGPARSPRRLSKPCPSRRGRDDPSAQRTIRSSGVPVGLADASPRSIGACLSPGREPRNSGRTPCGLPVRVAPRGPAGVVERRAGFAPRAMTRALSRMKATAAHAKPHASPGSMARSRRGFVDHGNGGPFSAAIPGTPRSSSRSSVTVGQRRTAPRCRRSPARRAAAIGRCRAAWTISNASHGRAGNGPIPSSSGPHAHRGAGRPFGRAVAQRRDRAGDHVEFPVGPPCSGARAGGASGR